MKAAVHYSYGSPDDVLELQSIGGPGPEDKEVLA